MQGTVKAFVYWSEDHYVARCLTLGIVTQGKTLDETVANLRKTVSVYLDGEDPAEFGLSPNPCLEVTLRLEPPIQA